MAIIRLICANLVRIVEERLLGTQMEYNDPSFDKSIGLKTLDDIIQTVEISCLDTLISNQECESTLNYLLDKVCERFFVVEASVFSMSLCGFKCSQSTEDESSVLDLIYEREDSTRKGSGCEFVRDEVIENSRQQNDEILEVDSLHTTDSNETCIRFMAVDFGGSLNSGRDVGTPNGLSRRSMDDKRLSWHDEVILVLDTVLTAVVETFTDSYKEKSPVDESVMGYVIDKTNVSRSKCCGFNTHIDFTSHIPETSYITENVSKIDFTGLYTEDNADHINTQVSHIKYYPIVNLYNKIVDSVDTSSTDINKNNTQENDHFNVYNTGLYLIHNPTDTPDEQKSDEDTTKEIHEYSPFYYDDTVSTDILQHVDEDKPYTKKRKNDAVESIIDITSPILITDEKYSVKDMTNIVLAAYQENDTSYAIGGDYEKDSVDDYYISTPSTSILIHHSSLHPTTTTTTTTTTTVTSLNTSTTTTTNDNTDNIMNSSVVTPIAAFTLPTHTIKEDETIIKQDKIELLLEQNDDIVKDEEDEEDKEDDDDPTKPRYWTEKEIEHLWIQRKLLLEQYAEKQAIQQVKQWKQSRISLIQIIDDSLQQEYIEMYEKMKSIYMYIEEEKNQWKQEYEQLIREKYENQYKNNYGNTATDTTTTTICRNCYSQMDHQYGNKNDDSWTAVTTGYSTTTTTMNNPYKRMKRIDDNHYVTSNKDTKIFYPTYRDIHTDRIDNKQISSPYQSCMNIHVSRNTITPAYMNTTNTDLNTINSQNNELYTHYDDSSSNSGVQPTNLISAFSHEKGDEGKEQSDKRINLLSFNTHSNIGQNKDMSTLFEYDDLTIYDSLQTDSYQAYDKDVYIENDNNKNTTNSTTKNVSTVNKLKPIVYMNKPFSIPIMKKE